MWLFNVWHFCMTVIVCARAHACVLNIANFLLQAASAEVVHTFLSFIPNVVCLLQLCAPGV